MQSKSILIANSVLVCLVLLSAGCLKNPNEANQSGGTSGKGDVSPTFAAAAKTLKAKCSIGVTATELRQELQSLTAASNGLEKEQRVLDIYKDSLELMTILQNEQFVLSYTKPVPWRGAVNQPRRALLIGPPEKFDNPDHDQKTIELHRQHNRVYELAKEHSVMVDTHVQHRDAYLLVSDPTTALWERAQAIVDGKLAW